ncbi:hypothetical protein C8J56DRAFT_1126910 [Mycena floridula]|nr:hypothetical protein C8J56DRAFT_1126910 [Mycena floridula]
MINSRRFNYSTAVESTGQPGEFRKMTKTLVFVNIISAFLQTILLFLEIVVVSMGRTEHATLFRWVGYAAACCEYVAYMSICIDIILFSGFILAMGVKAAHVFARGNVSVFWVPHFLITVVLPGGFPRDMLLRMYRDGFWILSSAMFLSNPNLPILKGSLEQFSQLVTMTFPISSILLTLYILHGLVTEVWPRIAGILEEA